MFSRLGSLAILLYFVSFAGCQSRVNPSFAVTMDQANVAWSAMRDAPKPLARPVIVLGGIYDPGFAAAHVARRVRAIAGDHAPVIHVGFLETGSFDRSARKVIAAVDDRFPSEDAERTVEVDAIGFSMGGLVARYAASDMYAASTGRRLNIRRLFTVSSPHQGAKLAWVPTFDSRVVDMRADSQFLQRLNAEHRDYELYAYTRLGDEVVGERNSAPPDVSPMWLDKHHGFGHSGAYHDTRILADIARRLRNESPLATDPPAPLPE